MCLTFLNCPVKGRRLLEDGANISLQTQAPQVTLTHKEQTVFVGASPAMLETGVRVLPLPELPSSAGLTKKAS